MALTLTLQKSLVLAALVGAVVLANGKAVAVCQNATGRKWLASVNKSDLDGLDCTVRLSRFGENGKDTSIRPPGFGLMEVVIGPKDNLTIEAFVGARPPAGKVRLPITLVEIVPPEAPGGMAQGAVGWLDYTFEPLSGGGLPGCGALSLSGTTLGRDFQLDPAPEAKQTGAKPSGKDLPIWVLSPRSTAETKARS